MPKTFAADCHAHVFDPVRFPFTNVEEYEPSPKEVGTPAQFRVVLDSHGITHGLLVNPQGGYATDNRCMLDALAASNGRFKGVALVGHEVTDRELQRMSEAGVVGARFSTLTPRSTPVSGEEGKRLLARLKGLGWFAQIHCQQDEIRGVLPVLKRSGIRLVVDHCGRPNPAKGVSQPGFQALLELGRSGNAAVKLSGAFRYSKEAWPYRDCEPFVEALIDAFTPDNCVWGSDWPFVRIQRRLDYGPQLALVARWLPDADARRKIMWESPVRWFGFKGE